MGLYKLLLTGVLILLMAFQASGQDSVVVKPSVSCVIWQGFKQSWGYNHRLNRMGDYIDNVDTQTDPPEVDMVHTAATGLGTDTCNIETYYTYLKTKNISVNTGDISFQLLGFKGQPMKVSQEVIIPVGRNYVKPTRLEVLINGFDIYSNGAAQKLETMSITLSDPKYVDSLKAVKFTANVELTLDCRSLECPKFNPRIDYRLHVFYILLGGPSMHSSSVGFQQANIWDKKKELKSTAANDTIKGIGGNKYKAAVVGFRELRVYLNNEHWMLDWRSYIEPVSYNSNTGKYIVARNMLFKQWAEKMRKSSEKKMESVFAERRPGASAFVGKLVMVQFASGCTQNGKVKGNIKWRGKNISPDQPRAVLIKELAIDTKPCKGQ